ncbi:MAG: N-acetyl-gamma-glutamyl-phosphate reductase [Acidobacteriota bacterium]|nr:N-acetyl-gamma-glutamyl-phosphate reductase [Acidobacteriota bacterium]
MSITVGIAGATGYAGQELLRLAVRHPALEVTAAMGSGASEQVRTLPALTRIWDGKITPLSVDQLAATTQAVFLTLPDAVAATVGPDLMARGVRVFDLSGTFRLRNVAQRHRWYPATPDLDEAVVYGLPEHYRADLPAARLVACPGCYPTAAVLALRPLCDANLLEGDVVVDAKSGISGAGKRPTERTHFSECHGSVAAYGVLAHRHGAEIEQELNRPVTFTPHLVPLDRGILETIYVRTRTGVGATDIAETLERAYADAPFVRLTGEALPEIKHVTHTNLCDIGWKHDPTSRRLVMIACLDNLVKGAAGQALQNLNLAFGLDEVTGLL